MNIVLEIIYRVLYFIHEYRFIIILTMFMSFIIFFNFFINRIKFLLDSKQDTIKDLEKSNEKYQESIEYYEFKNKKYLEQINSYKQEMQSIIQEYEEKIKAEVDNKKIKELENIKKGKEYEYKVKLYYESLGYKVFPNGYIKGKSDEGIDLIAYKQNEVRLIQVKNYKNPPKQYLLRIFIGDCQVYVNKNIKYLTAKTIYKDFITSCDTIDYGVKEYLKNNPNEINYQIKQF